MKKELFLISLTIVGIAVLVWAWNNTERRIQECARKYASPIEIKYCVQGYTLRELDK